MRVIRKGVIRQRNFQSWFWQKTQIQRADAIPLSALSTSGSSYPESDGTNLSSSFMPETNSFGARDAPVGLEFRAKDWFRHKSHFIVYCFYAVLTLHKFFEGGSPFRDQFVESCSGASRQMKRCIEKRGRLHRSPGNCVGQYSESVSFDVLRYTEMDSKEIIVRK